MVIRNFKLSYNGDGSYLIYKYELYLELLTKNKCVFNFRYLNHEFFLYTWQLWHSNSPGSGGIDHRIEKFGCKKCEPCMTKFGKPKIWLIKLIIIKIQYCFTAIGGITLRAIFRKCALSRKICMTNFFLPERYVIPFNTAIIKLNIYFDFNFYW